MTVRRYLGRLVVIGASLLLAREGLAGNAFPQASPAERALINAGRATVQEKCECVAGGKHGAYMRCVAQTVKAEVAARRLSRKQMHEVMKCAARSTCGRAGTVTCCKTNRRGRTKCAVLAAAKCKAPRGGTACASSFSSWCDATEQGCAPAQVAHDTQCCLPSSAGGAILDSCELLKPDECATNGGQVAGDGTCDPNPCPPPSTTTTTTTATTTTSTSETTTTETTTTTTTTLGRCGDGIVQPELNEQCDPPWSRNSTQCPPLPGHRFGPECGDDCRCVTTTVPSTTTTSTTVQGSTTTTTVATTTTTTNPCGNGVIDGSEQCDPPGSSCTGAFTGTCQADCSCPSATTTTASTTTTLASTTTTTSPETTTTLATTTTATTTTATTASTTSTTATTTTATTASTTSTTVTTTSSTTTTTGGVAFNALSFTTTAGTANCGGAGLASPPAAPLSGQLDSDLACTAKVADLGLGCLYFGGGGGTIVPPGLIPNGATNYLAITGPGTLGPSAGTSLKDCSLGANQASKHCINNNAMTACASDANCNGAAGACAADARCFFGPPLPIPSPVPFAALTTCVLNAIQTDAGGTFDAATGATSVQLPLSSRVYITGNSASPCPKCVSGTCDSLWKTNLGKATPDAGKACTTTSASLTTADCRPDLGGFQAPLGVDLTPLTTGTASKTHADGFFCPGQTELGAEHAGAFGKTATRCIKQTGTPSGDISDGLPHQSVLGSVFCIPPTGNGAVDGVADLPGPGAIGLNGTAQLRTLP